MNRFPKVSIITVCYNSSKTITQTIESVLGQTYNNIEYIIIDGLSTDGTQDIIKKYVNNSVRFICERDNGIFDAMNKGIQQATGEIIGIINSDDWYTEDAVEKVVSFFSDNEVGLVHGRVALIYSDGSENVMQKLPLETLWYKMSIQHPSVFIRRDVYETYGIFDLQYKVSADYELMLRLYSQQVRFGFIDDVIAYFRDGGISKKSRCSGLEEQKDIFNRYINIAPNKDEILQKFQEYYKREKFLIDIKNDKNYLLKLLNIFFAEDLEEIIIFGAGRGGSIIYEVLKDTRINIKLFIDNDSSRWGQMFRGICVASPAELENMKGEHILISVKDGGDTILKQLKGIGNKKINYVTLEKLADFSNETDMDR